MRCQLRPWIWPLPRLDGVAPCILESASELIPDDVELGYPVRSAAPGLVPVFAARDGVVIYAGTAANGSTIGIDHAGGWSTEYAGLVHVLTRPTDRFRQRRKERVQAGDVIGHAPRSPLRIRFSVSRWSGDDDVAVDPGTCMRAWSMLPWFTDAPRVAAHPAV